MADESELARADSQSSSSSSSSSDEETVKGDRDEGHIGADAPDDESRPTDTAAPPAGPSSIAHRYRELLEAQQETASEDGSADALPRPAASPLGSVLSVPDDTPSLQVFGSASPEAIPPLTAHHRAPECPPSAAASCRPPPPGRA